MRCVIVSGLLLLGSGGFAQTPAPQQPAPPPRQTQPVPPPVPAPAPATRRPPAAPARAGMAITVTDPQGATLAGVRVEILGASDRSGDTNASGQINFPGLQPGSYRLRFSGDQVHTFEREITIRAGQVADVDITLNPAPPPPEPPPPPPPPEPPPPAAIGPAGQPQTLSIVDLIERQLIAANVPRGETVVACSGNTRTTLVQLNQDQPQRLYESAEISYYVVAGEGAVRLGGRDTAIAAGSLVSLPRGTAHALVRRGRRPLILLVTLSGAPCEEAR